MSVFYTDIYSQNISRKKIEKCQFYQQHVAVLQHTSTQVCCDIFTQNYGNLAQALCCKLCI